MKDDLKLLEKLTQTPSVPGREERVRTVIQDYIQSHDLVDEMRVDAMGSLITVRHPRGGAAAKGGKGGKSSKAGKPLRVMLAAHMDQIGFLVSWISGDGFLNKVRNRKSKPGPRRDLRQVARAYWHSQLAASDNLTGVSGNGRGCATTRHSAARVPRLPVCLPDRHGERNVSTLRPFPVK